MNFYNPYFYSMPTESTGLLSKLSLGSILSGANKTLNVVNQTIPLVKQMSPLMKNMKTIFSVMNEFKKVDEENIVEEVVNTRTNNTNVPIFFI